MGPVPGTRRLDERETREGDDVTGRRVRQRRCACAALVPLVLLLVGCGGKQQNALAPESHASKDIASLFWWMMGGAWIGLGLVVALLLLSWRRRGRRGFGDDTGGSKPGEKVGWYVVVGGGIVVPIVLLATLFVVSDIFVIQTTEAPAATATRLTVSVTGHEWWWEVRYAGTSVVTANEIHIPVRTPVRLQVGTADVIHSFWVPQLNRTIDTIPGRTNAIELYADRVGRYRGQCDEFCGLQHAHMAFYVYADPPAVFRRWLAAQARPAATPRGGPAQRGARVFLDGPCSTCHTIRGTSAHGYVGPDLTHVGSRSTLASLTIPNSPAALARWITDTQDIKPGSQMPDTKVTGANLRDLVAYLEGLR
jgi:cytochrome c oxidase subunit II